MKSKLRWISGILGTVLALSLVFGAGVYASQNWLDFTDDDEIEEKNIAYDNLQQERDTIAIELDQAIADRDNLQSQYNTLNEGYTQLQTELTQVNEYVDHLEAELTKANNLVEEHANYQE